MDGVVALRFPSFRGFARSRRVGFSKGTAVEWWRDRGFGTGATSSEHDTKRWPDYDGRSPCSWFTKRAIERQSDLQRHD